MVEKLKELKEGRKVEIPKYSFIKHSRLEETATVYGANVIILEGNLALHEPRILDLLDMKVLLFFSAPSDH
jgi:uridine kinase